MDEKQYQEEMGKYYPEAEEVINDPDKFEEFLRKLEEKLKTIPKAGKYLADIPILISMVRAYVMKEYTEIPLGSIVAVTAALLYFLSPIDIIPDTIPGVGLVDDAAVIGICLKLVNDDLLDYKKWRAQREKEQKQARS